MQRINAQGKDFFKKESAAAEQARLDKLFKQIEKDPSMGAGVLKKSSVPEDAKNIPGNDMEGMGKELKDLQKEFKFLIEEGKHGINLVKEKESEARKTKQVLQAKLDERGLLLRNGQLEKLEMPLPEASIATMDTKELVSKVAEHTQAKSPFDPIVMKLAKNGYDVAGAFDMLDDNGDGVLTKEEIREGFKHHNVDLTDEEWDVFVAAVDENGDGVLTYEEWEEILVPKVNEGNEYYELMGDKLFGLRDPLLIQERTLDLMYRGRKMEEELKVLRVTNGDKLAEVKRAKADIKKAEAGFEEKSQASKRANEEVESKLKETMFQQDEIKQKFDALERRKEQQDNEYSLRLTEISGALKMNEQKYNDLSQYYIMMKGQCEESKNRFNREHVRWQNSVDQLKKVEREIAESLDYEVSLK